MKNQTGHWSDEWFLQIVERLAAGSIQDKLNKTGVCVVAVPTPLQKSMESLGQKACLQYASKEFAENIVLLTPVMQN